MKCNVGKTDRLLRIIIGLVILVIGYGFIDNNWVSILGVIILLTGVFRWCPAYLPCKISTEKSEK